MLQKTIPLVLAVGLGAALVVVGLQRSSWFSTSLVPKHIADQLTFPAYVPTDLPQGFAVLPDSMSFSENVFSFEIDVPDSGDSIFVNEQERPKDFDFSSFYNEFTGSERTHPDQGELMIGSLNGHLVASLLTRGTWVIATAPSSVDFDSLALIAERFSLQR